MTIQEILILIAVSLILGVVFRKTRQVDLLMAASIAFIFWLQPETELRFLGYWLPSITLAIMVLTWAITASPEIRTQPEQLRSLGIIIAVPLLLSTLRFLDPDGNLGFVAMPRILTILPYFVAGSLLLALLARYKDSYPKTTYWGIFGLILLIFIILKTPFLAQKTTEIWRSLAGQSTALAAPTELSWLGFSYLAFRLLHMIRDKQTGRLPDIYLNEFITYLVFFPAFVAGPIARADQFTTSLREISQPFSEDLTAGSRRIIIGLFKKFVIADSLALIALNAQNALQTQSALGGWTLIYAFSLQIYFDFSGYTDIAIGLGNFLNIQLPENFNRPYLKANLTQFWSNWHMTLTNWFRAYFFNPISRQMRKRKRPALAILFLTQLSTMVLVGLWHGVTINFIIWGLWHGLGLLIQNRWSGWIIKKMPPSKDSWGQSFRQAAGIFLTFHYVTLGWIWFILPTPGMARDFLLTLLGIGL